MEKILARMKEISAEIEAFDGVENFTEEQTTKIAALRDEYAKLTEQYDAAKTVADMKAKLAEPVRATAPATPSAKKETSVAVTRDETARYGGFKSNGDYLAAVRAFGQHGKVAPQFQNVMYEKNGEDGGFLVPEDLSTAIYDKLRQGEESWWGMANVLPVSGNSMRFPTDESQPWNGGIRAYWTAEGDTITESKPKFGMADLRLHKLAALVKPTDELLDDVRAMEGYITRYTPTAIMWALNGAVFNGDGVGKPLGILNSPFTLTISKESGQSADTVVYRNLVNMVAHLIPAAIPGAKFYVHPSVIPQLMTIKDDLGNFLWLNPGTTMNQGRFATILGIPVVPMMSIMPTLGDKGDILLANFEYYSGIQKAGGVKSAVSIHAEFAREITSFRFSLRVDGKVPFKSPVTTEKGSFQMSAFIVLEDR